MLLEDTTYKSGDIVTIKLFSGEELVGRFDSETDTIIKIKMPLTLVASQQGIGLQQYLFTTDPKKLLPIQKSALVVVTPTVKNFADAYQQQTSGIIKAPAGMADALKAN